jgi:hypothetical protein
MFGGVAVFGLATITSTVDQFPAVAGGADRGRRRRHGHVYVRTIMVQQHTPDHIRGRVSAVNSRSSALELGARIRVTARWLAPCHRWSSADAPHWRWSAPDADVSAVAENAPLALRLNICAGFGPPLRFAPD